MFSRKERKSLSRLSWLLRLIFVATLLAECSFCLEETIVLFFFLWGRRGLVEFFSDLSVMMYRSIQNDFLSTPSFTAFTRDF